MTHDLPACEAAALDGATYQLGLEAHGHQLAGVAVVSLQADTYALSLLAFTGLRVFTVTGPPTVVDTGLPAWAPWLERLPLQRDLSLLLGPGDESVCAVEHGRVRTSTTATGWERDFRGRGGRAHASWDGDVYVLADRRRGYRLTMKPLDPHG